MRYLYGAADDKYVKSQNCTRIQHPAPLQSYQYRVHDFLKGISKFDKDDVPRVYKVSPDTLLHLAARVVDAIPLPSVYTWTNVDVCKWIRAQGYPQYQNTFRENLINGRTLLLLDAAAFSDMNIKDFGDIKSIAYGVRSLFFFELTKFARSISLASHFQYELYKLFRVKSGLKYEQVRRTDLWRKMQLLREQAPNLSHWELLEKWLAFEPRTSHPELFGGGRRRTLYRCGGRSTTPMPKRATLQCACSPPCECYWTARDTITPWRLLCLPNEPQVAAEFRLYCQSCVPPCTCGWSPKRFMFGSVLSCLQFAFPQKYGAVRANQWTMKFAKTDRMSTIQSSI